MKWLLMVPSIDSVLTKVIYVTGLIDHKMCWLLPEKKNPYCVHKDLASTGLWNTFCPAITVALIWFCGGKEAAYSTEGRCFVLKCQFQPCFYSFPRTPSGSHEGEVDSNQIPNRPLLMKHSEVTRRGRGQGADPWVSTRTETMGDSRT